MKTAYNVQQAPAAAPALALPASALGSAVTTQPVYGYRQAQNYNQQVRLVNGRAFYQNQSVWTDSTAQSRQNLRQQQIKFNSDDYFKFAKDHRAVAQWLALGNNIDIVVDDTVYQIRE